MTAEETAIAKPKVVEVPNLQIEHRLQAQISYDSWIAQQILKLSVDALSSEVLTCTACAERVGEYLIEYQGKTFRYSPEQTYALLKFLTELNKPKFAKDE